MPYFDSVCCSADTIQILIEGDDAMPELSGSCLCGSLTYKCDSPPLFTAACHCTDCQKSTGTSFSVVVGAKDQDFSFVGDTLKLYTRKGDSGSDVHRHFCGNCGSTVFARLDRRPDVVFIKAGTLDDVSFLKPELHVYWRSAHAWLEDLMSAPKFGTVPSQSGDS